MYEAPILAYNKEMEWLVKAYITSSEVEVEDFATCLDGGMMELDNKKEIMASSRHGVFGFMNMFLVLNTSNSAIRWKE
jgi:hypothetical protein